MAGFFAEGLENAGWEPDVVYLGLGRIVALYYPLILFIPESLTYLLPLFLKRQCD